MAELILVDGKPSSSISVMDRGLHYGDGVFRTMKVKHCRVRWWEDQYRKLAGDCAALAIPCPDKQLLQNEVEQIAARPGIGVLKVIVTRGVGLRGYGIDAEAQPARIVMGFPSSSRENLDVRVRWCKLRLSHQPGLAGIKHLNRLENVLARSEWNDGDIAEGLIMDNEGHLICGTMTNLLIAEGDKLVTPDISKCGIAGVTRERIMRAAEQLGQPVSVGAITPQRLLAADEVMLCNSLVDVWRVIQLEEKHWPATGWAEKLRNWLDEND